MKKVNYQSPEVEVINLGTEGVLCASGMSSSSMEVWTDENFDWSAPNGTEL